MGHPTATLRGTPNEHLLPTPLAVGRTSSTREGLLLHGRSPRVLVGVVACSSLGLHSGFPLPSVTAAGAFRRDSGFRAWQGGPACWEG